MLVCSFQREQPGFPPLVVVALAGRLEVTVETDLVLSGWTRGGGSTLPSCTDTIVCLDRAAWFAKQCHQHAMTVSLVCVDGAAWFAKQCHQHALTVPFVCVNGAAWFAK